MEGAAKGSFDFESYARAWTSVEGWFQPVAGRLFLLIDRLQKRRGIEGPLFEIGVYHGKSAIVLGAMAGGGEQLGVCDPWDGEVREAREAFLANFATYFPEHGWLSVHAKRSGDLAEGELPRGCRFFHIDGGHSARETAGDLRLAARSLSAMGVIAIDDVFNAQHPGVVEGFADFMAEDRRFLPFLIGFNKVFLARREACPAYLQGLEEAGFSEFWVDRLSVKRSAFMGGEPFILGQHPAPVAPERRGILTAAARALPWLRNPWTVRLKRLLLG